jgi:hypothetical protein
MLRQYGRLGIIIATVAILFILLSLNVLQSSPQQSGAAPSAQQHDGKREGEQFSGAFRGFAQNDPDEQMVDDLDAKQGSEEVNTPGADVHAHTTPTATIPTDFELQTPTATSSSVAETTTPPSKIIVLGKLSTQDTDWVAEEMTEWQNAIYYVDLPPEVHSPSGLKTKMNKAKEVMPYLTYIVDNYPDFPDVMAFIHAHRRGMVEAWHNDAPNYDAVNMLNALRLETVLDRGYVNLRCNNEVGCPDEIQPWRTPSDPEKHAEHAFPYVYANFFNMSFAEMKEKIPIVATQCCAQFAVSKEQMLKKPKTEYERYKTFVEETHYDDATAGRVLEYMWHIIFDREPVHCENVFECWCNVYGRCRHTGGGGRSGGKGHIFGF